MIWSDRFVADALRVEAVGGEVTGTGVSTDTRTLTPGNLFVALVGERFDGHEYLATARDCGAAAAVVVRGTPVLPGFPMYQVPDTLNALGALGAARRSRLPSGSPIVAVTGSSGKTTVKEMIAAVLGMTYHVHATERNENNLVGVPLTLLRMPDDTEAVVVEIGANEPGEIARLRDIVCPTIAVVTNVGPAHVEGLGPVEQILTEKVALVDGAELAVVGADPPALAEAARKRTRTVVAGTAAHADVTPVRWAVRSDGRAHLVYAGSECTLRLVGLHQVENAMIALAVGAAAGVPASAACEALAEVSVPGGRMEVFERDGLTIVQDCYNANPDSLRVALQTLEVMKADRRSVILVGTMLELGAASARWHRALAAEVAATRPAVIGAVGEFVEAFDEVDLDPASTLVTAPEPEALGVAVRPMLQGDEIILLKASRGVALERVLPYLTG